MPAFVALLRGINVGKAKRVPMAELRALLTDLGYTDVTTFLNSGNVVFNAVGGTSINHAANIANVIAHKLKVEVPVIVKSTQDLAAIISENPLTKNASDHSRLLVVFVQGTEDLSKLNTLEQLVASTEQFVVGKNAAYLNCLSGILESKAGKALLGKVGKSATTRNLATVLKLQAIVNKFSS